MNHGRPLMSLRWAYQANVMNTFEQISRSVVWSRTGMCQGPFDCDQTAYNTRPSRRAACSTVPGIAER